MKEKREKLINELTDARKQTILELQSKVPSKYLRYVYALSSYAWRQGYMEALDVHNSQNEVLFDILSEELHESKSIFEDTEQHDRDIRD